MIVMISCVTRLGEMQAGTEHVHFTGTFEINERLEIFQVICVMD